jgi:amino acid adenylation domain-containing protein
VSQHAGTAPAEHAPPQSEAGITTRATLTLAESPLRSALSPEIASRCKVFDKDVAGGLARLEALASSHDGEIDHASLAVYVLILHMHAGQATESIALWRRSSGEPLAATEVHRLEGIVRDAESFAVLMDDVAAMTRAARGVITAAPGEPAPQYSFEYRAESSAAPRDDWRAGTELHCSVTARQDQLSIRFDYDPRRFSASMVDRWIELYGHVLSAVARAPATPLRQLDLLPPSQRVELLESFAGDGPMMAAGKEDTVDLLLRACVAAFPDRPAVTCASETLTYAELERRAAALARRLIARGLRPAANVAIHLAPSVDVAVAMLGVLRAGAAYVPVDRGLPAERVRDVLEDSDAQFVIGAAGAGYDARLVELTDLSPLDDPGVALPEVRYHDAAYVIYTSGTTGRPKGVVIEHHNLVHYVRWFRDRYSVDSDSVAVLLTSHAFDLGYTTLWTTLLSGGHLHILPEKQRTDVPAILRYFRDHQVTFVKVTPSLLGALVGARDFHADSCGSLRLLVTGGEPVRVTDVELAYQRCPRLLVVNHYGPTETTIGVVTQPIARDALEMFRARPVLGKPIGNTRVYVTSPRLELLPLGAAGELLIAGRGVARGYHRREELMAERFIADPFVAGQRAYRTGDLVRWTEDGALEFLGRRDRQIKIRGYRVELAEIELAMRSRLDIAEVVVAPRPQGEGNHVLCAYYVAAAPLHHEDARAALQGVLPEYMIPSFFTAVPEIPRTANGKLDVARLPAPEVPAAPMGAAAPADETEQLLVELWADVLGLGAEAIGATQNFFQLGGHSLLMIQLIADIEDRFGVSVPIPVFFAEGTVRALAHVIKGEVR